MAEKISSCIVSILDSNKCIVGAGFLISPKYVLTCAHVITKAIGISSETSEASGNKVRLNFPLIKREEKFSPNEINSHIIIWQKISPPTERRSDIAVLELEDYPPCGSQPGIMLPLDDLWEHPFRAFGFPAGSDSGIWVHGLIRGEQADGWVMLEAESKIGYFIDFGFSGTPVWDNQVNGIVGMIIAREADSKLRTAYMIPSTLLIEISEELRNKEITLVCTENPASALSSVNADSMRVGNKTDLNKTKSDESIVIITSNDESNNNFGTGFVIRRSSSAVYVLTCAHIIKEVGGPDKVIIDEIPAIVVRSGEADGLDLVVLKVEGLWHKRPLKMKNIGQQGTAIRTIGFQLFNKARLMRPLKGILENQVVLQTNQKGDRIRAWDLQITDDHTLTPGYNGSPVFDQESDYVLGVVSHRQGQGKHGFAISIEALDLIWKLIDSEQLYRILLKLGFRQQVRLFHKLINTNSIAAVLIYGSPEYGQRWLLNRLVTQYLPNSLTGKVLKVEFARKARRIDVNALWRELARRVGLKGHSSVDEISNRVYRWWKTQNVLLVLHDVNCLSESSFHELIQGFWLPLASKARKVPEQDNDYKLLMFLIDYTGCVGEWNTPFVKKLDSVWNPQFPIRSPKLEEFSDNDLMDWIETECDELPPEFKNEGTMVKELLENSEEGIPELVLQEICDRCGCDWYEEIGKWLKF